MSIRSILRGTCARDLLLAALPAFVGCKHTAPTLGPDALLVKSGNTTLGWSIDPSDRVRVAMAPPEPGKPLPSLSEASTGTLVYRGPDGTAKTVPMTVEDGILVASGPPLSADLTEVDYTIAPGAPVPIAHAALVDLSPPLLPPPPPPPIHGTLYVPPGGTAPLVAAGAGPTEPGIEVRAGMSKPGPHGGVVQIVDGDPLEIAATKEGTVRAYLLSPDLARPAPVGDRKITLGVVADSPETVVLVPDPSLHFFVGHWHLHADPVGITVYENVGGRPHVAIVGYRPGTAVVVGVGAPVVRVAVVDRWDEVDVRWWPRASVNAGVGVGIGVGVFGVEVDEDHEGDHDHGASSWLGSRSRSRLGSRSRPRRRLGPRSRAKVSNPGDHQGHVAIAERCPRAVRARASGIAPLVKRSGPSTLIPVCDGS
jgi:hypothetical protein